MLIGLRDGTVLFMSIYNKELLENGYLIDVSFSHLCPILLIFITSAWIHTYRRAHTCMYTHNIHIGVFVEIYVCVCVSMNYAYVSYEDNKMKSLEARCFIREILRYYACTGCVQRIRIAFKKDFYGF